MSDCHKRHVVADSRGAVGSYQSRLDYQTVFTNLAAPSEGIISPFLLAVLSLTLGPPPFSSMNSMPAASRAETILLPVSSRAPRGPAFASRRLIFG